MKRERNREGRRESGKERKKKKDIYRERRKEREEEKEREMMLNDIGYDYGHTCHVEHTANSLKHHGKNCKEIQRG